MRILLASSFTAIAASLAYPAAAEERGDTAQPAQSGETPEIIDATDQADGNEIVVIGTALRGQVDAPQPPILELDEADIATYGAGSLAELVQALSAETGSGRGRGGGPPTFLVNGLRVSSFREMRSYPPEAIRKVEVLAEEVAQRYGFSPDQRVINFILKDNFSSREIEVEYGQPFDGGTSSKELEATLLNISGPSRLNVNLELNDSSLLTEAERGVIQSVVPVIPGDPDQGPYRSLVSDSEDYELTANWTRAIGEAGASLSLNGTAQRSDGLSFSGLNTVTLTGPGEDPESVVRIFGDDFPLARRTRTDTFSFGSTVNARAGDWQLTGTIDASHADATSKIDRRVPTEDLQGLIDAARAGTAPLDAPITGIGYPGYDISESKTDSASAKVTAMGNPILLPAGEMSVTLDSGFDWQRIDSSDTRNPDFDTKLTRGNLSGGVNVSVPIASRREDALAFLGDLTANFSAGAEHLSDFGTLADWSAGLNWGLTERLNFQASYIFREAAPGLSQLGAPTIVNFNVPVYDFATSQTALATVTTGGNPDLSSETQRDIKLGLSYDLPLFDRSNLSVEYFRNRSNDVTASFPLLTPEIEAAFPDRVTRGAGGTLLAIDQRPVTFAEQNSQRIRIGLNISGQIGSRDEGGGRGPGGGGFRGSGGPGGDRVQGGAPQQAGGQGRPGGAFDPERFAEVRQRLCAAEGDAVPDISTLPEQMQARLRGPDGQVDPQRLAEMRTRMCSAEGGQPGAGQAQGGAAPSGDAPQQARQGGRGPGGRGFFPGGGRGGNFGRWNLSLNHTIELENEVLISDGGPLLDLLDGDAVSGGGVSRHTLSLQGGVFYNGFGTRLSGNYRSGTRVDGSGLPGSSDLYFGDLFTLDLRMFADLGRQEKLVESVPFLKNTRVSFAIDNLFDTRQEVIDQNGVVPLRYQPFLMDPIGRRFEVEFRKMF